MARLSFTSYRRRNTRFTKAILHDWLDDTDQNLLEASLYFPKQQPGTILHRFIPTDGAYLQNTFLYLIESAEKNSLSVHHISFLEEKL